MGSGSELIQYAWIAGGLIAAFIAGLLGIKRARQTNGTESEREVTKYDLEKARREIMEAAASESRRIYAAIQEYGESIATSHREIDKRLRHVETEIARLGARRGTESD